jgi:glycosyltransferase involved in cell wall biosynthesis
MTLKHYIRKINNFINNIQFKIINILICFGIFSYLLIMNNNKKMDFEPSYRKINEFESYNTKSFLYSFFIENEISKIKKFWKINSKNELINKIGENYKSKEIPEISVIITVYNQVNCFYRALRSVQNQSLKNIEIIIVDDCSTDNSVEIIEKYQKEDNRIILLKHLYNYGKIKSRSDGIKISKGKYITIIDGDDGLSMRDILFNCINIAKIGDIDVVEFNNAYFLDKHYKNIEKNLLPIENLNKRIIYQPELKFKFIKIRENERHWSYLNRHIWSKLIRNEIFNKVLEFIGPRFTEDYIMVFEDTIMSVSLFILSNSYYLMREPGYYRSKGECLESIPKNITKKCGYNYCIINPELDSIKYLNFLLDKLNTSMIESELIYHELLTIDYHFDLVKNINHDFNYVYKFFELLLSKYNFYDENKKNRIINLKNRMILKEKRMISR